MVTRLRAGIGQRLSGGGKDWPSDLMMELHGDIAGFRSQRILRTDRYKFVYNVLDRSELYDLQKDPHELTDVYDVVDYHAERTALANKLIEWMKNTKDPIAKSAAVAPGI